MPFESVTFTTEAGKTVYFVRIVDAKHVITQLVEELLESDNLEISTTIHCTFHSWGIKEQPLLSYCYKY